MRPTHLIPFRELVTTLLIAAVSICCCQANVVLAGTGPDEDAGSCGSGSCCSQPARSDAPRPDDDRDREPAGCKSCCIKGSGLKDGGPLPLAPSVTVTALHQTVAMTPTAPLDLRRIESRRTDPSDSQTLLRLHCALIV